MEPTVHVRAPDARSSAPYPPHLHVVDDGRSPPPPLGRCPANRASLAGWLLALAGTDGCAAEDGRVFVALSVSELNERAGRRRNCGSLFKRLRALRPAVICQRAGLLLDRAALAREAEGARGGESKGPGRRDGAKRGDRLVGFAADQHAALALSLSELARVLAPAGGEALTAAVRLAQVVADLVDGQDAEVSRAAGLPVNDAGVPGSRDWAMEEGAIARSGGREGGAIASGSRDRAVPPEEGGREVLGFDLEKNHKNLPPSLRSRDATDSARGANEDDARPEPESARSAAVVDGVELDGLLAPLLEACDATGKVGVTCRPGVVEALAPYAPWQIASAVRMTCLLTRSGTVTSSPVGWLVRKAKAGDPDYFPPAPPSSPPGVAKPRSAILLQDDLADAAAEEALAAATAEELAELDEEIRRGPNYERFRSRLADPDDPALVRRARLLAIRARQAAQEAL